MASSFHHHHHNHNHHAQLLHHYHHHQQQHLDHNHSSDSYVAAAASAAAANALTQFPSRRSQGLYSENEAAAVMNLQAQHSFADTTTHSNSSRNQEQHSFDARDTSIPCPQCAIYCNDLQVGKLRKNYLY